MTEDSYVKHARTLKERFRQQAKRAGQPDARVVYATLVDGCDAIVLTVSGIEIEPENLEALAMALALVGSVPQAKLRKVLALLDITNPCEA